MNEVTTVAFSIPDACRALGIGRTHLYREIKEGRLRAVKHGRRTLILRRDAEKWADSLEPVRGAN